MMGINPTDTILIPSSSPTGRALVQRGSDIFVLSVCCLSTYSMYESSSGYPSEYKYACEDCGNVSSSSNSFSWVPHITDVSVEKLTGIRSSAWADWIKYWFGIEGAEVEIS